MSAALVGSGDDARIEAFLSATNLRYSKENRETACQYLKQFNWIVPNAVAKYTLLHPDYPPSSPTQLSQKGHHKQHAPDNATDQATVTSLRMMRQTAGRTNLTAYPSVNAAGPSATNTLPNIVKNRPTSTQPPAQSFGQTPAAVVQSTTASNTHVVAQSSSSPQNSVSKNPRLPRYGVAENGAIINTRQSDNNTGAILTGNTRLVNDALQTRPTADVVGIKPVNDVPVDPRTNYNRPSNTQTLPAKRPTVQAKSSSDGGGGVPVLQAIIPRNDNGSVAQIGSGSSSSLSISSTDAVKANTGNSRLTRGFSRTAINQPLVTLAREIVLKDITVAESDEVNGGDHSVETSEYTFSLPDIMQYPEDLKAFLYKDLIETSTLVSLEQEGHLNWWADVGVCQRLFPMATSGDGNCLLHAASIAMWGFHDRLLVLRKALCEAITSSHHRDSFQRRWRWQAELTNRQCGLVLSEAEWAKEWDFVVQLASPKPCVSSEDVTSFNNRQDKLYAAGQPMESSVTYQSLEDLHVYVLAHILRRPIIVIAKKVLRNLDGEALAPIPFGGIYLPLEVEPTCCHRAPLMLTYDAAHFCALVPMEMTADATDLDNPPMADAIPLVTADLELLPIHFLIDPGIDEEVEVTLKRTPSSDEKRELLHEYMDLLDVPMQTAHTSSWERDNTADKEHKGAVHRQMNQVKKSIGNFGESFSKAIKGVAKQPHVQRKPSIGTITQSTRRLSHRPDHQTSPPGHVYVLCACLLRQKMFYVDELVQNYIESAKSRFHADQDARQRRHAEIRRLSVSGASHLRPVSFPPQRQYRGANEQPVRQKIVVGRDDIPRGNWDYDGAMYNCTSLPRPGGLPRQNTILAAGKSKFYMTTAEDHCLPLDDYKRVQRENAFYQKPSVRSEGDEGPSGGLYIPSTTGRSVSNDSTQNKLQPLPSAYNNSIFVTNAYNQPLKMTNASSKNIPELQRVTMIQQQQQQPVNVPVMSETERMTQKLWMEQMSPGAARATGAASNSTKLPIGSVPGQCRTDGCEFHGTKEKDFFCSNCYKARATSERYSGAYRVEYNYPTAQTKL